AWIVNVRVNSTEPSPCDSRKILRAFFWLWFTVTFYRECRKHGETPLAIANSYSQARDRNKGKHRLFYPAQGKGPAHKRRPGTSPHITSADSCRDVRR